MASPIEHVFVLMLENRSFDHLFAYSGIPALIGVDTSKTNPQSGGGTVPMSNAAADAMSTDPQHEFEDVDWQMYGAPRGTLPRRITLDGFVDKSGPDAMLCVDPAKLPVLTELARQFLVCDYWFSSMPGPTWPNRFFVHAASSGGLANSPSNLTMIGSMNWSTLGFSFDNGTLFDALKKAGRTWRVYHGDHFPQVCAIDSMPSVFVADPNKFRSFKTFAADVGHGDVASYTFIEPDYDILSKFRKGNSQHPTGALSAGEQLIKDVYEAVGGNPQVWSKSMLFFIYDEHGGYYDQEPPPQCTPPGDSPRNAGKAAHPPTPAFAFDNYGVRVPAVVVCPLLRPRSLSHETYDHTSIIRTVFDVFGIPGKLTARDGAAKSLAPLLQPASPIAAPPKLPNVYSPNAPAANLPPPIAPSPRSIDGFTRIAAQIDHALQSFAPLMQPTALQEVLRATPDIRDVVKVPISADPNESLSYLEGVAARIDAHRVAQGQGPVK
jgi:phospholipase C